MILNSTVLYSSLSMLKMLKDSINNLYMDKRFVTEIDLDDFPEYS